MPTAPCTRPRQPAEIEPRPLRLPWSPAEPHERLRSRDSRSFNIRFQTLARWVCALAFPPATIDRMTESNNAQGKSAMATLEAPAAVGPSSQAVRVRYMPLPSAQAAPAPPPAH